MNTKQPEMMNQAITNIIEFLKNPEDKKPLAQASLILETVQYAVVINDVEKEAQTNLVQFIGRFVDEFAMRTGENVPEFANGIIPNNRNVTASDIARILAKLRCLAVNQPYSDYIINHLSFFIERLEIDCNASSKICKKFCFPYSEYSDSIVEMFDWAFKTFNPPIYVAFNSKEEWASFRAATPDEGRYACKYNGIGLAVTCKTALIDKFDDSKYPIEVRVNGIKKTGKRILNMSNAEIESIRAEMRGLNKPTIMDFVKKLIIAAVAAIILIAPVIIIPIVKENKRVKEELKQEINEMLQKSYEKKNSVEREFPDSWMVGKWRASMSSGYGSMTVTLEIDKYGNTFETIEYSNGGYERNSFTIYYDRDAQQLYFKDGSVTSRFKVYPSSHTFGDGELMFYKY